MTHPSHAAKDVSMNHPGGSSDFILTYPNTAVNQTNSEPILGIFSEITAFSHTHTRRTKHVSTSSLSSCAVWLLLALDSLRVVHTRIPINPPPQLFCVCACVCVFRSSKGFTKTEEKVAHKERLTSSVSNFPVYHWCRLVSSYSVLSPSYELRAWPEAPQHESAPLISLWNQKIQRARIADFNKNKKLKRHVPTHSCLFMQQQDPCKHFDWTRRVPWVLI